MSKKQSEKSGMGLKKAKMSKNLPVKETLGTLENCILSKFD